MLSVVVTGAFDKLLLEKLLQDLSSACRFHVLASEGKNAARPLAKRILVAEGQPVAFVLDADSSSEEQIRSEQREYEEYFNWGGVGAAYLVLQFRPEIEAVFFDPPGPLERLLGRPLDPSIQIAGRYAPKKILETLLPKLGVPGPAELVERLTDADWETLRTNATVKALREFIRAEAEPVYAAPSAQKRRASS